LYDVAGVVYTTQKTKQKEQKETLNQHHSEKFKRVAKRI